MHYNIDPFTVIYVHEPYILYTPYYTYRIWKFLENSNPKIVTGSRSGSVPISASYQVMSSHLCL